MKKIKFRVWDEEERKMYIGRNAIVTFTGAMHEVYVKKGNSVEELYDYKIMQYTEFQDINGKMIYEGDIVQCNGNKEDLHEIKFGKFPLRDIDTDEIVDFVTGWYFIILENDKFSKVEPLCYPTALNGYWINKIDVKVIGNIYEKGDFKL